MDIQNTAHGTRMRFFFTFFLRHKHLVLLITLLCGTTIHKCNYLQKYSIVVNFTSKIKIQDMKLLEPTQLGALSLKNKMVMSAMTRSRADVDGMINDSTVEYYRQRSSAGLLLSEGINISPQALGSPCTPGLYNRQQVEAWKKVTRAVHDKGGIIFAQLWH